MGIKAQVERISTEVTTQQSYLSSILSILRQKLNLNIALGDTGTPIEKNSQTLLNIAIALGRYNGGGATSLGEILFAWQDGTRTIATVPVVKNESSLEIVYSTWEYTSFEDPVLFSDGQYYTGCYQVPLPYETISQIISCELSSQACHGWAIIDNKVYICENSWPYESVDITIVYNTIGNSKEVLLDSGSSIINTAITPENQDELEELI